ncbi:Calx-beta domain-containing protein [Solitalea koreensis]|nr:Calx-beta domain-containing protein [Solitalea koreensis]
MMYKQVLCFLFTCLLFLIPTQLHAQQISINNPSVSVNEGNSGTKNMVFPVSLSAPNAFPITLNYAIGGTADAADFGTVTTQITIPANTTSANIIIPIAGDDVDEDDETVIVTLQNADNGATISATNTATGIIVDDDNPPVITIYDPLPQNEANPTLHFPITLSNPSSKEITINFAYDASSTATGAASQANGVDYNNSITSVTIPPGHVTASIPVGIYNDKRGEAYNETIVISSFSTTSPGVTFSNLLATGTILDNDGGPDVTFEIVSSYFSENAGIVKVRVRLTGNITEQDVTVPYTVSGTATLGSDFQITNFASPLIFAAATPTSEGERVKDIEISIADDAIFEPNETVIFTLLTPTNAFLGSNKVHTLTILNDETSISILPFESSKAEGSGGVSTDFTFNVIRDPGSQLTQPIDFTYSVSPASTSAAQASDFLNGTFPVNVAGTILAGQSNVIIKIPVKQDSQVEPNENFTVTITPQSGVSSSADTADGTIQNDDNSISLAFDVSTVNEGGTAKLTAKLPIALPTNTIVNVVLKGTANGSDYTYNPAGAITLTIPANSLSSNAYIFNILDDGVFEGPFPETLIAEITSVVTNNVAAGASATLQIIDSQTVPTVSISSSPTTINENSSGAAIVTVTLSSKAIEPVIVDLSFEGTAELDNDYSIIGSHTLVIPAGSLSATIQIKPIADNISEGLPNETVNVGIINVSGGGAILNAAQSSAIIEVVDSDVLPVVSITAPPSVVEGHSGTIVNLVYPIKLSRATKDDLTINFSFDPSSTATGGPLPTDDYDNSVTSVTILAGQTSGVIVVPVRGDDIDEGVPSESVIVKLISGVGYTVNTGSAVQATGLIVEDDFIPVVNVAVDFYAIRETGFPAKVTIRAVLANPKVVSLTDITVQLNLTGTATNGADYNNIPAPITLTIPANQISSSTTVDITAINDLLYEGTDETIIATISDPSNNAQLGIASIQVNLQNVDAAPSLTIDDITVAEGNSGTQILSFTVTKIGNTSTDANVDFVTLIGTATTVDNDFVSNSGTITFSPSETTKTINIIVNGDTKYENDETFSVRLQSASYARIAKATGLATIINDDVMPQFSISDISVNESAGLAVLTVTKTGLTALNSTVSYTTNPGTATAGTDYTTTAGTLTFLPDETTKTISVPIINDLVIEPGGPEIFTLTLNTPVNASISAGTATISIVDDDNVEFYVESKSVKESAGIVTYKVFKTNNNASAIDYTITSGTAILGTDFTVAVTTGTFSFTDNDPLPYREITVNIINNSIIEPDKSFTITLSNPTNGATITAGFGIGTEVIVDDDAPVDVAIVKIAEDKKVSINTEFDYSLIASNKGATLASGIVVTDTLPVELEYINANSVKGTINFDQSNQTVTWQLDSLSAGTDEILTIRVKAKVVGNITNSASIVASMQDYNLANNTAVCTKSIYGFIVPNAFSPNNDGINDWFIIPGIENIHSEMVIYNRYGAEVYRIKNYQNNWAGNGIPTGTYYYVIKLNDAQGKNENMAGSVTIFR